MSKRGSPRLQVTVEPHEGRYRVVVTGSVWCFGESKGEVVARAEAALEAALADVASGPCYGTAS